MKTLSKTAGLSFSLVALLSLMAACVEVHGEVDIDDPNESARVAIRGKPVVVKEGDKLAGNLVVIGGEARVDGEVEGDLVVVAGKLHVGPKARIRGELVSVGNEQSRVSKSAQVEGARVNVDYAGVRYLVGNFLWAFDNAAIVGMTAGVGVLLLMLLAWLFIVRRYDGQRFHGTVEQHPVRAGVVGFFVLAGLHVLIGLAFLSRYGIGLMPVFGLAYAVLAFIGWLTVAGHIGRLIARRAGWDIGPFLYGLLGVGVALVAFLVPVIGQLAWVLAAWVGVGALIAPATINDRPAGQDPLPETYGPTPEPKPQPTPQDPTAYTTPSQART